MEMHHTGWRSPDSMRAPPRQQPPMSPYEHHHRSAYVQSSREDMRATPTAGEAGGGTARARPRTASQRPHEQAMWPNPWLRRHWDSDAPLDLNKPLDESKGEMEGDELTTARAFQPSFAMDLNDLVHSLWTPPKPSPLSPRNVGHSSPVTQVTTYPSPPVQRHAPQHDETPTPEEYEWGARRGNSRPTYEMESRSKRVTPPSMREPMRDMEAPSWSEHDEESRFRRYMEAPPRNEYSDPRPQRQQYDPPMGRPYADRDYYDPSHQRRVVPSSQYDSYETYAPRLEDDGYHSADEYAWRTPGKNPRTTPGAGVTNPQRSMETRMMNPPFPPSVSADPYVYGGMEPRVEPRVEPRYYVHDMESMRHQSEMERRLMADRGLRGVEARTYHADPIRDPRMEPRTGTGMAPPLRRARSDPRTGLQDMPQMPPPEDAHYHQYQYQFQRDARTVRASPSPQRSSPFLSPHSNTSSLSPSIHSAPFRESPSYVSRMAPPSSDTGDEVEF